MSTPGICTTMSQPGSKEQPTKRGAHPTPVISSIPYHPATTHGPQNQTGGHHPYVMIAQSPMHGTVCAVPVPQTSSVPLMFTAPYPPHPAALQMPAMAASPYFFPYGNVLHFSNRPLAAQLSPQSHSSPVATEAPSAAITPISPSAAPAQRVGSVSRSTETKVSASIRSMKSVSTPGRPLTQATSSVALSPSNLSPVDLRKQSVSIEMQENRVAAQTARQQFVFPLSATSDSHQYHSSDGTGNTVPASLLLHSQRTRGDTPKTGNPSLEQLLQPSQALKLDPIYSMLQDEPHFVNFCRYFKASESANHLRMRVLTTEGTNAVKWIEITRQASHIDPTFGPVDVVRVLLSSNGLCKVELLFPYFKTVYTKFMPINQEEADKLLDELSPRHVLCPGLLEYRDKYTVLGYHPTHVRVLETPYLQRYDHESCPIWHIPSNLYSKSSHIVHNMCKQCKYLQNNLVRLATKACEIDPTERQSWTDPSSNRPLAYMSASDKEERYRKLRQERSHLLNKLKVYEERLGINAVGDAESITSITSIKSESGESGKEEIGARKQSQNDGTALDEVGDVTAETKDNGSPGNTRAHASSEAVPSVSCEQPSDEKTKGSKRLAKKRQAAGSKPQQAAKKPRAMSITAETDISTKDSEETKPTKGRPRKYTKKK